MELTAKARGRGTAGIQKEIGMNEIQYRGVRFDGLRRRLLASFGDSEEMKR